MITNSNPFLRNDYYPDQNDIDELNTRINEVQSDVDLLAISVNEKTEAVNGRLNTLQNDYNESFETDALKANTADLNVLNVNVQATIKDLNVENTYTENLIVNKPVLDLTLRTPHLENTTSLNGNFYAPNIIGGKIDNIQFENIQNFKAVNIEADKVKANKLIVDFSAEPILSSTVVGYDENGQLIPAITSASLPEDADYLKTDAQGIARKGTSESEVVQSTNLIQAGAVQNMYDAVNANFDNVQNTFNDFANNLNSVSLATENLFNDVNNMNNSLNDVANSIGTLNNTTNNISDNLDSLLNMLAPILVVNISGWNNSTSPLNIKGITEFTVAPLAASQMTGSDVGNGAKLNLSGTTATLALPTIQWTTEKMVSTFENCKQLNQYIQIPNGVTAMVSTFEYCSNLNQNIQIPNSVVSMISTFGSSNLNQNIKIPSSVVNMYGTFKRCWSLNQNIQIPNSVTDMQDTFDSCSSLNQNILIPNSVTSMINTFSYCWSLNQNIQISNSVVNMTNAFYNCSSLNQNILIPSSVVNMYGTFDCCFNLNQNIQIPNSVITMYDTFKYCFNLNQNIKIPNSVVGMHGTFNRCSNLNQNILIPNSVTSMYDTFYNCSNLNQSILIPNSVVVMTNAFYNCSSLDQPDIYIYSQNLSSLSKAFNGCYINNVHIPTSVPKDTSNLIYNSLVNGNTGITFPAANIFNDLPVDPVVWPPVA